MLGRPFLVMERAARTVYEMNPPAGESDDTMAGMCRSLVEALAAIHAVDLDATGLKALDDGATHLVRELDRWSEEMSRVRHGRLSALERLHAALRDSMPAGCPTVTLVHGDAGPGNFAFANGAVSTVVGWKMATVGDPLTDVAWLELRWM